MAENIFMLEKINPNDFDQSFKINILEEFNELKEAYSCKVCLNLFVKPVVLNTCRHIQCEACLESRLMRCSICKYPYTKADIKQSNFSETVVHSIWNIENIAVNPQNEDSVVDEILNNTRYLDDKYEVVIAQTSMKRNSKGETPLHLACKKGNIAKVEELVKSGVDINVTDWGNWSALHEAIQGNHLECIELLLKNGVLIDTPGISYMTPLHEAIRAKTKDITILLLKYGANMTSLDSAGCTPIDYISNNQEMLTEFESIKPVLRYKPKLFFKKEITVYNENLDDSMMKLLKSFGVQFSNLQSFNQKNENSITHFITSTEALSLNLLLAILKGIFIVDKRWIQALPPKIHPFEYIPETYKLTLMKSIQNALEHKPKLFDGINFHIVDHGNRIRIHKTYFTKRDIILLIETGGGNVVSRCPTLLTVQNQTYCPYHAQDTEHLKECCNYIIFDESVVHELMYVTKELRHKTSKWLIDCILQFKILD